MIKGLLEYREGRVFSAVQKLILLLAFAWILFAFSAYLPSLMHPIDTCLRRTGIYDILLALWFTAVAYCVGRHLFRLIGLTASPGAEESAFAIAVGLVAFSWITLILSLTHGLYRPVAYVLLLIPTAVWGREMSRLPGRIGKGLVYRIRSLSWNASAIGGAFIGVYLFLVLGVVLISALGPSLEYDDLVYHLPVAKNFILAHKLVSLPDVPHTFLPKNIEMLHTFGMLLHNEIVSKLLVFLSGCITMLGVFGFCVRFASRNTGKIAVAILASSPLFIWEMRTAHVDIGLTLFLFVGIYATVLWLQTREAPWLWLASLFLAFSLGIKYWAFLAIGIILLLVFIKLLLQSRNLRTALGGAFKLGLYSSLGIVPWGLVNLFCTGNPLFPLLNGVFKSPYWTTVHTNMGLGEWFQGGIQITLSNWWDLFRLAWEMMTDPQARFGGNVGPWYVLFVPLLLFFPGMGFELGFLLGIGILYYVGWAVKGPWVRFLLPALPCLAPCAAFAVLGMLRLLGKSHRIVAIMGTVVLSVLAILASPFFEAEGSWSRYGNPPMLTLPLKYLSGGESKREYLRWNYRGFKAVEYLNQVPGEKKVLFVHSLADGFYLDGKAAFHYSPYIPGLERADADQIHTILRQHGITHVVVEQPMQESSPLSSRESDFNHRYLRKLFQRNSSIVYELLPGMADQTVVVYDFMDHLGETQAIQLKPGNPGSAYKQVRSIGDDSRYAMVTEPPSTVEFIVKIPEKATLSFAAAREDPGYTGMGSTQVWISTSDEEPRLIYSRDLEGSIDRWIENQVDLSSYAGHRVAITFKTADSSGGKYFWADPVVTAPNGGIYPEEPAPDESAREPRTKPTVLSGKATPASVKIGDKFEMRFSGVGLTSDLYFDLLYVAPHLSGDHIVNNWQYGTSLSHSVSSSITPGKWLITGVRAHRNPSYHQGTFDPVRITLDIAR